MTYDDSAPRGGPVIEQPLHDDREEEVDGEEEENDEQSRQLTHDEIWDDSALVEAWDSAMAEYKAFHGQGSDWKEETVKKSPLWYNTPAQPQKSKGKNKANGFNIPAAHSSGAHGQNPQASTDAEADSAPLDFDTFMPTHDPSLTSAVPLHPSAVPGLDYASLYTPNRPGETVSQDEAFSRALAAMYWGGYWTAVYHSHRNTGIHEDGASQNEPDGVQGEAQVEGVQDEEILLPTQR